VKADSLADHLKINRYGKFTLTDAIRPGPELPILPREGYRIRIFRDPNSGLRLPMLSAAISVERLFDVFLDLLEPLGEVVSAVIETSHGRDADDHLDYRRSHIDRPVLASYFCDFEDLLMNDGCTGVAVLSAAGPIEVQFDEHKLLHVYAKNLKPFRRALKKHGIRRRVELPLLCEGEHLHHTTDEYEEIFGQMCTRIGVADFETVLSDE
jgi:hypothetical protein